MNNKDNDLLDLLKSLYDRSRKLSNKKGLKLINTEMNTIILDYLKEKYAKQAQKYILERDKNNKKIKPKVNSVINTLNKNINIKTIGSPIEFKLMSSYSSGLNLVGESDIDIGCLVDKLDIINLMKINVKLYELGFVPTGLYVNPKDSSNKYFSFEKTIDGIEFEVKVRDKTDSNQIVQLDELVETKLTKTQKKFYTYAKYILKGSEGYKYIKLFIAESVFFHIKNSYMFN